MFSANKMIIIEYLQVLLVQQTNKKSNFLLQEIAYNQFTGKIWVYSNVNADICTYTYAHACVWY